MAKVNSDISDLFFNTDLDYCRVFTIDGKFSHWDRVRLHEEANTFLGSLGRLGVKTPTASELVVDFLERQ